MKHIQKSKRYLLHNQEGGILPIVLVSIFLLELSFFGTFRIYQNKMHTYETLVNHYQSQTLLAFTEKIVNDEFILSDEKVPTILSFTIGEVRIVSLSAERYVFTSQLTNGFSEKKEVTILKTSPVNNMQPPGEFESGKVSIQKIKADDPYRFFFNAKKQSFFNYFHNIVLRHSLFVIMG